MNSSNYYSWGLPINVSAYGDRVDQLIWILTIASILLFFGWFVFLVFTLVKFRQRPGHKAEYHSKHFKLPTYAEIVVAIFEFVLLFALSAPIWAQVRQEFPPTDKAIPIRVVAQQYQWNVHYAGKDKVFGKVDPKFMSSSNFVGLDMDDPNSKDDVVSLGLMHVPVDTPILVDLTSKDVIHCFTLPVMRVKQDVIPGQQIPIWFQAKKTGEFEIACAQLCGVGHYRMKGYFTVESRENFDKWLADQAPKS